MPRDIVRRVLLALLIERMNAKESWCGETHVQKSVFFLQALFDPPLDYDYVIYKHGPYSFDLHDELTAMRANTLVELEPNPPYGPRFKPGPLAAGVASRFSRTRSRYEEQVDFIAQRIAKRDVADLERIATAFFLRREYPKVDDDGLADWITKLKPHISREAALAGISEAQLIEQEASATVRPD